jgi:hypothetical protein
MIARGAETCREKMWVKNIAEIKSWDWRYRLVCHIYIVKITLFNRDIDTWMIYMYFSIRIMTMKTEIICNNFWVSHKFRLFRILIRTGRQTGLLLCKVLHAIVCKFVLGHVHTCSLVSCNLYAAFQLLVTQLTSLTEPCVVFKSFIIQYQGSYICGPQNWKNHGTVHVHFLCGYLTMLSVLMIYSIKWQDDRWLGETE